ncbi:hypothetical protein QEG98_04500 [Myxococcus sp. MxC21-1]|nr:hypothetical protein QEG98_04500 [Myxococcus sp. MxC21-1]
MAATLEASAMKTPALPAWAPEGPTQTSTGTGDARKARTMWRVASSEPPGVSNRTSNASCPAAVARATQSDR